MNIIDYARITKTEAKATVEITTLADYFPDGCKEAILVFKYKPNLIFETSIDHFASKESQIQSLNDIESAWKKKHPIKIGSMGSGLKPIGNCTFESKGLAKLQEYDGQMAIYSFYDPI